MKKDGWSARDTNRELRDERRARIHRSTFKSYLGGRGGGVGVAKYMLSLK